MRKSKKNEMKKMVLGAVAAIATTAIVASGISQMVKAAEIGKIQTIPTSYSIPYTDLLNNNVPEDYVKKDYKVKLVGKDQPTANDLNMEAAAELASQNLWRIFQVDLSDQTLEMTYRPVGPTQLRAIWEVNVEINDSLIYHYALDAVTGENHSVAKWVYHNADIQEGMDVDLLINNQEYEELAKAAAEKYQFVSGKVTSVEYAGQGYQESKSGNKNADITFKVKTDQGEIARLTFSRYNQELLTVEFRSWIEETERQEKLIEQELKEKAANVILTDEMIKEIEENGSPILLEMNDN